MISIKKIIISISYALLLVPFVTYGNISAEEETRLSRLYLEKMNILLKEWKLETPSHLSFWQKEVPEEAFDRFAEMIKFTPECKEGAFSCPQAVGNILSLSLKKDLTQTKKETEFQTGFCKGTLVGDSDIVMTNRHCIPKELQRPGAFCAGALWFILPEIKKQNLPAEKISCLHIVGLSPDAQTLNVKTDRPIPDFAFFKLEKAAKRKSIALSAEALSPGQDVFLVQNYGKQGPHAPWIVNRCKAQALSSQVIKNSTQPIETLVEFTQCEIGPSDSGGPILDAQGRLRGLVAGPIWKYHAPSPNDPMQQVFEGGWGTHAQCIPKPHKNLLSMPLECLGRQIAQSIINF